MSSRLRQAITGRHRAKQMTNSNSPQNLIDVVSEKDIIVDSKSKDEIHRLGLLHREVHVWLFDKDKNIFFQKSGPQKVHAGLLDASVGGHVDSGEDYLEAAVREAKEETGLSIASADLVLLIKFRSTTENKQKGIINNFWRSVYIYKNPVSDEEIKDSGENDGFTKFPLEFLKNLREKDLSLFHRRVPTHELPHVIKYLDSL